MNVLFLVKSKGIYGALIRWWTGSPCVHAELEFSDGIRFTSLVGTGTTFLPPLDRAEEKNWKRVKIEASQWQEDRARDFCRAEINCGYDWAGIFFSQVIGWSWENSQKWFCSEVCLAALQHADIKFQKYTPCKTSPKKLERILAC